MLKHYTNDRVCIFRGWDFARYLAPLAVCKGSRGERAYEGFLPGVTLEVNARIGAAIAALNPADAGPLAASCSTIRGLIAEREAELRARRSRS